MFELKAKAPQQARPAFVSPTEGLHMIDIQEERELQNLDRTNMDVSMAWAGGRNLDARGIAEKFVQRPKEEVLHDLILLFEKQDRYTFEDINRVLQQPKPWMTEILNEYATTETEFGKRHFRLRPEFRQK